jgi:hypothetical protein
VDRFLGCATSAKENACETRYLDCYLYRAGSLTAVAEEISKYKLDLVGIHKVIHQQVNIRVHFSMERSVRIMN